MTTNEFLTIAEVASLFRVHPKTVLRWIKEGRIAVHRPGPRVVRIHRDQLPKVSKGIGA